MPATIFIIELMIKSRTVSKVIIYFQWMIELIHIVVRIRYDSLNSGEFEWQCFAAIVTNLMIFFLIFQFFFFMRDSETISLGTFDCIVGSLKFS